MSTRETIEAQSQGNIPTAGENATDAILEVPSCTIEDIDRGVFDLFDRDLPMHYTSRKQTKRVPVIFAAGERFALIARKKPLRDKNNALILPVLSIMRSGISADNEMGLASNGSVPHVVQKKLSRKDQRYQNIINKLDLRNSDDMPSELSFLDTDGKNNQNAKPGRFASRRDSSLVPMGVRRGNLLKPDLKNNIFEVLEIPPVQFITASYEITIWAQYVQQMNDLLMAIFSNMQSYAGRTFRLETKKGYTFVAYLESNFDPGNNFEDFTEDERIIRTSFSLKVPGYLLGETYPGAPNSLRKFISAPQVSFEMDFVTGELQNKAQSGIPSGDPDDFILDTRRIDAPLPGQGFGASSNSPTDPRHPGVKNLGQEDTALIGGATNDIVAYPVNFLSGSNEHGGSGTPPRTTIVVQEKNPFTGDTEDTRSYVKTRTSRNGETVYREVI